MKNNNKNSYIFVLISTILINISPKYHLKYKLAKNIIIRIIYDKISLQFLKRTDIFENNMRRKLRIYIKLCTYYIYHYTFYIYIYILSITIYHYNRYLYNKIDVKKRLKQKEENKHTSYLHIYVYLMKLRKQSYILKYNF